jgi:uncharacterized protein YqeY
MTLAEQIEKDMIASLKAKEELKLSVLRMAKAALMNKKIELGKPVGDTEAIAVLRLLLKQRHDSVEAFRKGGRENAAQKEEAEIKILEAYMPAAASDEEIGAAVVGAITEAGVTSGTGVKEFGKVMKAAMAKLAGKNADGKRVSELVRAKLGG